MKSNLLKLGLLTAMLAAVMSFTGCSKIPGDKEMAITDEELLSHLYLSEDMEFTKYDGDFSDKWQTDEDGNQFLIITSELGYCEIYKDGADYTYATVVDNVRSKGSFAFCMDALNPTWKLLTQPYPETVLSLDEFVDYFEVMHLNPENYNDYVQFEKIETKNEISGYTADYRNRYRPYKYMYNKYVGEGILKPDLCTMIKLSGTVDRSVTMNVYDLKYNQMSSTIDSETTGTGQPFNIEYSATYLDDTESFAIHYTPYQDPIESWYIHTYWNGIQEINQTLVEISNIQIKECEGTLVAWNPPSDIAWNTDDEGNKYLAIRVEEGEIVRYYQTVDEDGEVFIDCGKMEELGGYIF